MNPEDLITMMLALMIEMDMKEVRISDDAITEAMMGNDMLSAFRDPIDDSISIRRISAPLEGEFEDEG